MKHVYLFIYDMERSYWNGPDKHHKGERTEVALAAPIRSDTDFDEAERVLREQVEADGSYHDGPVNLLTVTGVMFLREEP